MKYDYYYVLGVHPDADQEAIKVAYRKKAVDCHPDRGGSHREMMLVNRAWDILSDPKLRERYDRARANDQARQGEPEPFEAGGQVRGGRHGAFYEFVRRDFLNATFVRDPDFILPWAGDSISGICFLVGGVVFGCWLFPQIFTASAEWYAAHPYWKWTIVTGVMFMSTQFGAAMHRTIARNLGFFDGKGDRDV